MLVWRWKILLGVFSLAYGKFAWAYDWLTLRIFGGYWHRWQLTAAEEVAGPRVLEIGVGPGFLLSTLAAKGFSVAGIDLAPAMAKVAARRVKRSTQKAQVVVASALDLPFRDSSFDTVIAAYPAPWIRNPRAHSEIRRVLNFGGQCVVMDGGKLTGTTVAMRLRRTLLSLAYGRSSDDPPDYMEASLPPWNGEWHIQQVEDSEVQVFRGTNR
jgi:ubiquinone/menaquinone biosynthesis C-methylase UbiE